MRTTKLSYVILDVWIYHEKIGDGPAFMELLTNNNWVNKNMGMKKLNWVKP